MSSLNKTPSANRIHISFFGSRNRGKSSLINALTNQKLSIVSDTPGTTTDPVRKAMEIAPLGPCVIIDTAGIDDIGDLGKLRIDKTLDIVKETDLGVVVVEGNGLSKEDKDIISLLKERKTPYIVVVNKVDIKEPSNELLEEFPDLIRCVATENKGLEELKKALIKNSPKAFENPSILGSIMEAGDHIVLVIPIDSGMPRGRLILPQVQTMRDILDNNGILHIAKVEELKELLDSLKNPPKLVITDSQAFEEVSKIVDEDIMLTSFSIIFARYKGDLKKFLNGAKALENLKDGSKILVSEACTHHPQSEDIGRVKLPRWIRKELGENITFDHVSGREYPKNLKEYDLILHCGGCTLNKKEMIYRIEASEREGVPIINYGMCIAYLKGIFKRAIRVFEGELI